MDRCSGGVALRQKGSDCRIMFKRLGEIVRDALPGSRLQDGVVRDWDGASMPATPDVALRFKPIVSPLPMAVGFGRAAFSGTPRLVGYTFEARLDGQNFSGTVLPEEHRSAVADCTRQCREYGWVVALPDRLVYGNNSDAE